MIKLNLKHGFIDRLPTANEVAFGELAIVYFSDDVTQSARLYTKDLFNNIIEIGKGTKTFADLEDIDLTNAVDGSYFVKDGDTYRAVNFIGGISSLTDVEITNPVDGQYLRYDDLFKAFRNHLPSYSLSDLLDVDVLDISDPNASSRNNQVLYYNHTAGAYQTRPRLNLINELVDVEVTQVTNHSILMLDTDGIWKNMPLQIIRDPNPTLGNHLNANGNGIYNYSNKVTVLAATTPFLEVNYNVGDYFVIQGSSNQCILNINCNPVVNTTAILMLELRQSTGPLLLGNLINVKYEDGNIVQLSGAGRTDLITVTVVNANNVITSYVTACALNLASLGSGGLPAYRYDQRFAEAQGFAPASLYDDFYPNVVSLFNFEEEDLTGKLWYEDKADGLATTNTTHNIDQLALDSYSFGLQDYVASFENATTSVLTTTYTPAYVLEGDFTAELYVRLPDEVDVLNTNTDYTLFSNATGSFKLVYNSLVNTNSQLSTLSFTLGSNTFVYNNALRLFRHQYTRYVHIAIVRLNTNVKLYVDGVLQVPVVALTDNPVTSITISQLNMSIKGLINSFRLTKDIARYNNAYFSVPSMRFGLTGGALDILHAQVFDIYRQLDEELEVIFF